MLINCHLITKGAALQWQRGQPENKDQDWSKQLRSIVAGRQKLTTRIG